MVEQGQTAAEKFLLRWRGEADPDHVKAIDTYWICTAEHGLNASTFTARVVASTGADCGAALSAAVGALSGPLHGGAPAYVGRCSRRWPLRATPKWVRDALTSGKRIMGFGHRVYRAEDPRSRLLKRIAKEIDAPNIEVAEELEVALKALRSARPTGCSRRTSSTTRPWCSTARRSRRRSPAMFGCSRVAGWSAHILEQKRTGRLFRPSATYVGPAAPAPPPPSDDAGRGCRPGRQPRAAGRRARPRRCGSSGTRTRARGPRPGDYRVRAQAYRAIAQFRFRQKLELVRRGLQDESRPRAAPR